MRRVANALKSRQTLITTGAAFLIGLALGSRFLGAASTPDALAGRPGAALTGGGIAGAHAGPPALAGALHEAGMARARLERRVSALTEQIAELQAQLDELGVPQSVAEEGARSTGSSGAGAPGDPRERQLQRFIDAGFTRARAEALMARQEEITLQRRFLQDQAKREGWSKTPRFRDQMKSLVFSPEALREELGDADYDRYLYATGRPNRVVVRDALIGGPADEAGLRAGDTIIAYDGERVFDARALVARTQEGSAGAQTALEIERDGQRLILYVPRGPLGARVQSTTREPNGGG